MPLGRGLRLLSAATITVSVLAGADPASAAAPRTWQAEPAAQPHHYNGTLVDLTCSGSTFCAAVGNLDHLSTNLGYSELRRDGRWQIVPLERPAGASATKANAVSCSSATWCVAVGSTVDNTFFTKPLIERWDGTAWTQLASAPLPPESSSGSSTLSDVSCLSRTLCIAVGTDDDGQQSFAERWDGASWQLTHVSPDPISDEPGDRNILTSVSCRSASNCVAVGRAATNDGLSQRTLVLRLTGSGWAEQSKAELTYPGNTAVIGLSQVACPAATDCTAVGYSFVGKSRRFIEVTLHAGTWRVTSPSMPPGAVTTSHLSCSAATTCYATLDNPAKANHPAQLLIRRDSAWSTRAVHDPSGHAVIAHLTGLVCRPAQCTIAGYLGGVDAHTRSYTYADGVARKILPTPTPRTTGSLDLSGVSCTSALTCTAAGSSVQLESAIVERRTQSGWQESAAPRRKIPLPSVSCASTSLCMLVGPIWFGGTLSYERWNGTTWSAGVLSRQLTAVSCPTTTFCAGVGQNLDGVRPTSAIWSPARGWRAKTVPIHADATHKSNGLDSISCLSARFCLAAGESTSPTGTLVAKWNGTSWSLVDTASTNVWFGVSCATATYCLLVGTTAHRQRVVASVWNGTSVVPQPDPPTVGPANLSSINAVDCVSATDCTAVGSTRTTANQQEPVIDRWDGSTWIADTPAATGSGYLSAVSCRAGHCVAVGTSEVSDGVQGLIERA